MNTNLMTPAEMEHADFVAGAASEMQNCFAEANMRRASLSAEASVAINEAVAAGKFVAVEAHPYFCKSTDAFAGMVPRMLSVHDTREEADAALNALYPASYDEECDYYVLPRAAARIAVVVADTGMEDDGVPF